MTEERKQFLGDIFIGIFEDYGTNSWRQVLSYHHVDRAPENYYGKILEIGDGDEDIQHRVDIHLIAKGINQISSGNIAIDPKMLANIKHANKESDAGDIDAYDADMILQAGLFGKLVYG